MIGRRLDEKQALGEGLDGKVLGLWNNDKTNAKLLLELIREELEKHYSFTVVRRAACPSSSSQKLAAKSA